MSLLCQIQVSFVPHLPVAELRVERAGGTFREVTVPFEVQPEGREGGWSHQGSILQLSVL